MKIILNKYKWRVYEESLFICGNCYIDENVINPDVYICNIFSSTQTLESRMKLLQRVYGNFAIVYTIGDIVHVITDNVSSYPIYYYVDHKDIFITDHPTLLLSQLNKDDIDDASVAEYLQLGLVSGNKTLIKKLHSVCLGSYFLFENKKISQFKYFELPEINYSLNGDDIFIKSKNILDKVIREVVKSVNGRTIILPLSGGYDSRLIACALKSNGYENVICFTYGNLSNKEINISKNVAESLHYKWYFVEYTKELLLDFINSDLFYDYYMFSGNFNVNPCFQDLPALIKLKSDGVLNSNMVVIPGHSGDFLGGSHFSTLKVKKYDKSFLNRAIYQKYYVLNNIKNKQLTKNKLSNYFDKRINNEDDFITLFTRWGIENRQSKFIINSVRAYEFLNLDWRIPLWNMEYASFWLSVPFKIKKENIYDDFMFKMYFFKYKVAFKKNIEPVISEKFSCIKNVFPKGLKIRYLNYQIKKNMYFEADKYLFDYIAYELYKRNRSYSNIVSDRRIEINSTISIDYFEFVLDKLKRQM